MKVLDTVAFKEYMRKECETNGNITSEIKEKIISRLKVITHSNLSRMFLTSKELMFWGNISPEIIE